MTASTPNPPVSDSGVFNSPMYRLVATKLGEDPATLIKRLRDQTPPMSYARIADLLQERTQEYVTDEIPRRWYLELLDRTQPQPEAQTA